MSLVEYSRPGRKDFALGSPYTPRGGALCQVTDGESSGVVDGSTPGF